MLSFYSIHILLYLSHTYSTYCNFALFYLNLHLAKYFYTIADGIIFSATTLLSQIKMAFLLKVS